MDTALAQRHEMVFQLYRNGLPQSLEFIPAAIEAEVAKHPGVVFRPDSRQFLVVNLVELVAKPMTARSTEDGVLYSITPEVERLVRKAIAVVVPAAAHRSDGSGEVSGHQVLLAVGRVWDEIKSEAEGAWG